MNFDYARDTVNQVHIDRNLAVARGLRAVTGELKFIKLLGWGGQGMAMLYYVRGPPTENEPNGELKYYVVKSTLVDREHQENVLMDELRVTQVCFLLLVLLGEGGLVECGRESCCG